MNGTSSIDILNGENDKSISNNAINPIETIDGHSIEEDVGDAEISIQNIEEVSNDVQVDPLLITATDIKVEKELMNMLYGMNIPSKKLSKTRPVVLTVVSIM